MEEKKYNQKRSKTEGQTERQKKSEIKTQKANTHKHTDKTVVQGRREKKHRKTTITLHVCKNTSCDCVEQSIFSNDVTAKSKCNSQPTNVSMLHYCSLYILKIYNALTFCLI
jgi:hypothetical protein